MTLGRLILAWLPVAVWFALVQLASDRLTAASLTAIAPTAAAPTAAPLFRRSLEAVYVTLLASLWFDSLGHGGWWLIFALLGLIAAWQRPPLRSVSALVDVARYVGAGALLAWRLG